MVDSDRDNLTAMPDMLRACARLSLGRAGPRDLAAVRGGLDRAAAVTAQLRVSPGLPPGLITAGRALAIAPEGICGRLVKILWRALVLELAWFKTGLHA